MNKTYTFQPVGCNNPLSWTVTTRCSDNISIKLSCAGREIIDFSKQGEARYSPQLSGEDISTSESLYLELTSDKEYELTFSTYHNLKNDGGLLGYTHTCFGYRTEGGRTETFQVEINSLADYISWSSSEDFIAYAYSLYLQHKDRIVMNYISDEYVGEYIEEMQQLISLAEMKYTKLSFGDWYLGKLATIKTFHEHRALIFAILKQYDDMLATQTNEDLTYVRYNNLLLILGKKQWREDRMTLGSSPFQCIRGIMLNDTELKQFESIHNMVQDKKLFTSDGLLTASACHASNEAVLGMKATRGSNFRNLGIYVYESANSDKVQSIIKKSVDSSLDAKILIFPELFINCDEIANLTNCLNQDAAGHNLELVVAGSYYKPSGNQYTNTATILGKDSDGNWKQLCEYNKVFPFSMGNSAKITTTSAGQYDLLLEDLYLDGNITLLGYKDCVVGVAICRDAMDMLDARNPLHRYCDVADLMLVISDNSGQSNMFVGVAECLARWHNCAMLYTNAVNEAADETAAKFLEISFGIYPYKNRKSSGSTSLSGVLSYKGELFVQDSHGGISIPSLGILNSAGIHYEKLSDNELENCVKLYTFKNFNNQNK